MIDGSTKRGEILVVKGAGYGRLVLELYLSLPARKKVVIRGFINIYPTFPECPTIRPEPHLALPKSPFFIAARAGRYDCFKLRVSAHATVACANGPPTSHVSHARHANSFL